MERAEAAHSSFDRNSRAPCSATAKRWMQPAISSFFLRHRTWAVEQAKRWHARRISAYGYTDMVEAQYRLVTDGLAWITCASSSVLRWAACTHGYGASAFRTSWTR
jgi:hypothetical protein